MFTAIFTHERAPALLSGKSLAVKFAEIRFRPWGEGDALDGADFGKSFPADGMRGGSAGKRFYLCAHP
jgi:hypothetical protein